MGKLEDFLELEKLNDAVFFMLDQVKDELPNYEVHSVYLTGTRLYGFPTEESDYDFKVYVYPTKEDLVFGNFLSMQFELKENAFLVESVTVRDVRYMAKELSKVNFQSLHLFDSPVYGYSSPFSVELLNSVLRNQKKNLVMSLTGYYNQKVTKASLDSNKKNLAHLVYANEFFNKVKNDEFSFGAFKNYSKEAQKVRESGFLEEERKEKLMVLKEHQKVLESLNLHEEDSKVLSDVRQKVLEVTLRHFGVK